MAMTEMRSASERMIAIGLHNDNDPYCVCVPCMAPGSCGITRSIDWPEGT